MVNMDAFPSVNDLVNGSKSNVGITDNWDMVVSYSLTSLNQVLQRLWTHSITSTDVHVRTTSLNEDDEEYHTNWWLRLGAPTLQFTNDGKASLCMPINGKRQNEGKDSKGNERPVKEIVADTYGLYAVIPLEFVSARTGSGDKAYEFKGGSGKAVRFDDHPDSELHVVLNFQTTTAQGAVYTVDLLPNYQPPAGQPKPPITDDLSVGLRDKLAAWIANPDNISCIQYALAVVNKKPVKNATFLTPETLSFSVYSSPNDKSIACLSIYMQTQGSGFGPGNLNRSFKLPASSNTNTFPIPSGHTASIIIRHDLFAQKFLRDSMAALQKDGRSVFTSVTVKSSTEGFDLAAAVNGRAAADLGNQQWWGGGFKVTEVDWSWVHELGLKVRDSKSSWSYEFSPELKWEEVHSTHDPDQPGRGGGGLYVAYGKTTYYMKLDRSGLNLFEDASDVGLVAKVNVQGDYWSREAKAHEYDFLERLTGAKNYIPKSIDEGLKNIELPSFSGTLALEYFTTTNIFAPGKHMLTVSGASSVYTPYDVIILGDVLDTPALTVSAPTSDKAWVEIAEAANDNKKNMSDLINDLSLGRPIMRQLVAAVLSEDDEEGQVVDQVLKKAGYEITTEDALKALEAENPGPNFDIRLVAGLYSFDEPVDLHGNDKRMVVDGGNGSIFIGKTRVNSRTDSEGNVTWTDGDHTYSITFTSPYKDNGAPAPKTFRGTRKHRTTGNENAVSGKQFIPNPNDSIWTNHPVTMAIITIISILGFGMGVFGTVIAIRDQRRKAVVAAVDSAVEAASHMSKLDAESQTIPIDVIDKVFSEFHGDIEASMREKAVKRDGAIHEDDPADGDPKAAADAAKETLRLRLLETTRTQFLTKLQSQIVRILGPEPAEAAMKAQIEKLLSKTDVLDRFTEFSPYVLDIVETAKAHFDAATARRQESKKVAAETIARAAVEAAKTAVEDEKKELKKRVEELRKDNQNITQEEIKADKTYQALEKKIANLEKAKTEALEDFLEKNKEREEAKEKKDKKEKDIEEREKRAKESAEKAFEKAKPK
ncbi:hypothetical protein QBC38DRAFT_429224 [Podospora fimiseda]|uniref:Uncharacterized protein n=1 Tax=Podospora fimiseda TaxID=252190 RepID=A0AAN7BD43_9PEZI|nr:hypothetical protein QBC38DRAFT_429224 [Podospora fimiseda]